MAREWNADLARFEIVSAEREGSRWTITLDLFFEKYEWRGAFLTHSEEKGQTLLQLPEGSDMPVAPGAFWRALATRIRDSCIERGWLVVRGHNDTMIDAEMFDLTRRMSQWCRGPIGDAEIRRVTIDYNRVVYEMEDGTRYAMTLDRQGPQEKHANGRPVKERWVPGADGHPHAVDRDGSDAAKLPASPTGATSTPGANGSGPPLAGREPHSSQGASILHPGGNRADRRRKRR